MLYLLCFEILLLICYLFLYNKIAKKYVLLLKIINSVMFVLLGFYLFILKKIYDNHFYMIILIALLCGLMGDIVLGIRNIVYRNKNVMFLIGLACFMVGHLFYISAMLMIFEGNYIVLLVVSLFLMTLTIIISKQLHVDFGEAYILDYIYILISSIFITICFLNFLNQKNLNYFIVFIGSFLFVMSDFLLSYLYFGININSNKKAIKAINIFTYYAGQIMLAFSILLI